MEFNPEDLLVYKILKLFKDISQNYLEKNTG